MFYFLHCNKPHMFNRARLELEDFIGIGNGEKHKEQMGKFRFFNNQILDV